MDDKGKEVKGREGEESVLLYFCKLIIRNRLLYHFSVLIMFYRAVYA